MEALRGEDFQGDWDSCQATPGKENGESFPWSPPPVAACMVDREEGLDRCRSKHGSTSGRASYSSDGIGSGGSGGSGGDGVGEGQQAFFEFFPFLNDATHNEMDSEAR